MEFADEMQNGDAQRDEDVDSFASERFAPPYASHRLSSLERELEDDWDAPVDEEPMKSSYLPYEMIDGCYNITSPVREEFRWVILGENHS